MDPLAPKILDQFPAARRFRESKGASLASNTMGLIPEGAAAAERACVREQQNLGIAVWDEGGPWMATLDRYAGVIGRMVDVAPDRVCPITNITDGLWRVFSTIDFNRGNRGNRGILTTEMAFTTQTYAGHGFARYGAEVVTVPSDDQHHLVPIERLISAIRTHKPAVVHLSHAAFESAYLHDAAEVSAACKEVGATFCLDAAQTGFCVPFTMAETGADVLLLQQHKWGCAGTGAAALVATEAWTSRSEPALVGWMSHARTFNFETGPAAFGASAWRFAGGTPDVPAKARGAAAAELLVDTVRIKRIRQRNQVLVAQLIEGLKGIGMAPIDVTPRTGFVAVQCSSEAEAQRIEHGLKEHNVFIDGRGARLRIGPHFYNEPEDIDACLRALRAVGAA